MLSCAEGRNVKAAWMHLAGRTWVREVEGCPGKRSHLHGVTIAKWERAKGGGVHPSMVSCPFPTRRKPSPKEVQSENSRWASCSLKERRWGSLNRGYGLRFVESKPH